MESEEFKLRLVDALDNLDKLGKALHDLNDRLILVESSMDIFSVALEKAFMSDSELGQNLKSLWLEIGYAMKEEYKQVLQEYGISYEEMEELANLEENIE